MRRRHLLAREETLADDLLIASFLMRRLVTSGRGCVLEPDARMTHYDHPGLGRALVIFGANGLCLGGGADRALAAIGRGIGSLLGRRWVERYGWLAEVKPVTAEMVAARGHWFG